MLEPGDEFYEEARFEFTERLQEMNEKQLIAVVNNLLDQIHGIGGNDSYAPVTDEELLELVSTGTENGEDNESN